MSAVRTVAALASGEPPAAVTLDPAGNPADLLTIVDLDSPATRADARAAVEMLSRTRVGVLVGVAREPVRPALHPVVAALDCSVVAATATVRDQVAVADPSAALAALRAAVAANPRAAAALVAVLRQTPCLDVPEALAAESATYSMLLAGPEFAAWRASRPRREHASVSEQPVLLDRAGDTLAVRMHRSHRRNAFDRTLRDALVEAFELVLADDSIRRVELHGDGPAFSSGGDLDEFGSSSDVSSAHLVRLERSVGARIHACRARVTAHLHGACIGAGIELPAFSGSVVAASDTVIRLPELGMGLIPGAGGTVSISRRIGRWRTTYLALTGAPIDAPTALEWGLVDRIDD